MSTLGRSALVIGLAMMATACGRKGALIYPDMLIPAAPTDFTVHQSGSGVKLQFALPGKDRAGRAVQGLTGVKIKRRTSEAGAKDVCRSCTEDYLLLRTLYLDHFGDDSERLGNSVIVVDNEVNAGKLYSYRIVPFAGDGVDGTPSPAMDILVSAAFPPPFVTAESLPTEIRLHISFSHPIAGRLLGFNLYRASVQNRRSYQPLSREPVKGTEYVDAVLERGVKYRYSARAVIMSDSGNVIESSGSDEVEGMLKDDE